MDLKSSMDKNEPLENSFDEHFYQTGIQEDKGFAIIHLDTQGNILRWNYRAELIFGFNENEIRGQHFSIIFTPQDISNHIPENELDKAQKIGRIEDRRWYQLKDGSLIYANSVTSVIKNENGTLSPPSDKKQVVRNLHERQRHALLKSEEKFLTDLNYLQVFFTISVLLFLYSGRILYFHDPAKEYAHGPLLQNFSRPHIC